jgi:thioredoxin-dependent peroxiredoxin
MTLTAGAPAPDFTLPAEGGGGVTLSALRGRKVVLFFYPKADTTACTQEAQDFTRLKAEFDAANVALIGISHDPLKALAKFRTKHALGVELATDEDLQTLGDYGVWTEKSMYGRKFMGIVRTTVLIDADGRIARVWPKVKVKGHAEEVLTAARAL